MDISETYIKMCEKAEEIQELVTSLEDAQSFFHIWPNHPKRLKLIVWLPRQDQLQKMGLPVIKEGQKYTHAFVKGEHPDRFINACLIEEFFDFCTGTYSSKKLYAYDNFNSMEQLWLAFVMKEMFGKSWNGEEWVI